MFYCFYQLDKRNKLNKAWGPSNHDPIFSWSKLPSVARGCSSEGHIIDWFTKLPPNDNDNDNNNDDDNNNSDDDDDDDGGGGGGDIDNKITTTNKL